MYKKAHAEIKKDPEHKPKLKKQAEGFKQKRLVIFSIKTILLKSFFYWIFSFFNYSSWTRGKVSKTQKLDRVKQKKASYLKKMQLAAANE